MRVKRFVCFLFLLLLLSVVMVPTTTATKPISELNGEILVSLEGLVYNNTTSGIKVWMDAPHMTHLYESEEYMLQLWASMESPEPLDNITVQVLMGIDTLEPPEYDDADYSNRSDPIKGKVYQWGYIGITKFKPSTTDRYLLGQLTHENETVNLTYEMVVLPARSMLHAFRIDPPNHTGDQELEWMELEIMIVNTGGRGETDLIVDLMYGGRILTTHDIPAIVGFGNYTITTQMMPVYDGGAVVVRLIQGPDTPRNIGGAAIDVIPRPILDVVRLTASPDEIESGQKVHIEALISNRGNATSTGQLVELMVGGSVVANATIEGLEPGNVTRVSTKVELRGEGAHTVSAVAEGDDFDAEPVAVEVKAPSPSIGVWAVLLVLLVVSLVARRSPSDDRA